MRKIILLMLVFAAVFLAGCLSDADWNKIWVEVGKQAINQTVSNLTSGLQPQKCEAGMTCESGRIMEIKCDSSGKETKSVVAEPYSCKAGTLITSTCIDGVFGQSQSSGSYYCNARGYLEEAKCEDNILVREEIGDVWSCYSTDEGDKGVERMFCSFGKIDTTHEKCEGNTTCRVSGATAECS